ncbi:MAG: ferritin-like domain-containing protein [Gemmatimonadaceae bacterium]
MSHESRADADSVVRATGSRRDFFRLAGLGGAALAAPALLAACADERVSPLAPITPGLQNHGGVPAIVLDFRSDIGVLNFAYALEQLEAAFYIMVIAAIRGRGRPEQFFLEGIRNHEVVHREFLKAALGSAAIPAVTPNFSSVNFNDINSILATARALEDTGVGAYNGAAKYLSNPDYLTAAGKIVSVEARHAATIRDIIAPKTRFFAGDDVVDANGLDIVLEPPQVLAAAGPFIVNSITIIGL